MPASNPLDILLEHDHWAGVQLLQACERLSPDQFAKKFEMGRGSLQATITHMIAAMHAWTDLLAERPMRPRIDQDGGAYSPAGLRALLDESTAEFKTIARNHPLDQILKRTREGKEYSFTRGAIITHVATHGMHHRAQCLNMLRHLGVQPLPPSSVAEWTWMTDAK